MQDIFFSFWHGCEVFVSVELTTFCFVHSENTTHLLSDIWADSGPWLSSTTVIEYIIFISWKKCAGEKASWINAKKVRKRSNSSVFNAQPHDSVGSVGWRSSHCFATRTSDHLSYGEIVKLDDLMREKLNGCLFQEEANELVGLNHLTGI